MSSIYNAAMNTTAFDQEPQKLSGYRQQRRAYALTSRLEAQPEADGTGTRIAGLANSGAVIPDHWFWGNLILDLSGGVADDRIYLMSEHETLAGIIDQVRFDEGIRVAGFVDSQEPDGAVLARRLKAGYPLQMSVYFDPLNEAGAVQRLEAKDRETVNGYPIEGPGHIIRKYAIREASACLFGADPHTRVSALKGAAAMPQNETDPTPKTGPTPQTTPDPAPPAETQGQDLIDENQRLKQQLADLTRKNRAAQVKEVLGPAAELSTTHEAALAALSEPHYQAVIGLLRSNRAKLPEQLFHHQGDGEAPEQTSPSLQRLNAELDGRFGAKPIAGGKPCP